MFRIRRDGTFEYQGELWHVGGAGRDWGYEIWRDRDGACAVDGLMTMREVRAFLAATVANEWPLIDGE